MTAPLALTAFTLTSALGHGRAPTLAAIEAGHGGLVPCDFDTISRATFIGRVAGLEDTGLAEHLAAFDCRNNRLAALGLAGDDFERRVAAAVDRYGVHRLAVIMGTTTSGILSAEQAFRHRDPRTGALPPGFSHRHTLDHYALADYVARHLGIVGPAFTVSTACSSSAMVFGDAWELIRTGICDAAVVGGVDSLCRMSLSGFASLALLSTNPCRPNDVARDGISIGEAAGFALLERDADAAPGAIRLLGFGASCDAHHMSAPDPAGAGAARAMREALASAGLEARAIDYVHQHGTGTVINDAAEDLAIASVIGPETPCSSTKGLTGHTLGAAGITNALLAAMFLQEGLLPRSANLEVVDPAFRSRVLAASERRPLRHVLSNAFGFGGTNCCLVLGVTP
jgi:3-oxoacyl-[acyl-carrier-protein] synthase-1